MIGTVVAFAFWVLLALVLRHELRMDRLERERREIDRLARADRRAWKAMSR